MIKEGVILGERYEIMSRIGAGGMADVYKARDQKLDRMVAVKVLKPEFREDANFIVKFRKEAQAAAGLAHPNVVNVFDVGEDRGLYFIVMELVEGITLKAYITRKGKLSVKEATSIAIQVSLGLEAAHNRGIVHRDVKPQNIIISTDGKVKLSDFGIAKATNSNTITGNVMGSVHYSSPEQVRGGASDARSDVYSLGITMYEMVTGRVPYDGDSTVSVAIKHLQEEMVPPSRYTPDLPYSLEQIILKCTQKNPERRYQNMAELVEDLKHSLLEPQGNFVSLTPLSAHAQTATMAGKAGKTGQTSQTARAAAPARQTEKKKKEDYEEFEDDRKRYRDDDDDDDMVSSKLEKAITIGGILIGAVIVIILVVIIGNMAGLFHRGGSSDTSNPAPTIAASSSGTSEEEEEGVEVPSFLGKTVAEATSEANGLSLGIAPAGTAASEEYPEGQIISQDPVAGTRVDENTTIRVTVSSGPEVTSVTVPSGLVGASQSDAEDAIAAAGLQVASEQANSDSVAIGHVISVNPNEGTQVEEGSTVTITVSVGPEEEEEEAEPVVLRDLLGLDEATAKQVLDGQGLTYATTTGYDNRYNIGDVIAMDPEPGTEVPAGTSITLTINSEEGETAGQWVCQNTLSVPSGYEGAGYVELVLVQGDVSTTVYSGEDPWADGSDYSGTIYGEEGVSSGTIYVYIDGAGSASYRFDDLTFGPQ